jgi:hypothetical protein
MREEEEERHIETSSTMEGPQRGTAQQSHTATEEIRDIPVPKLTIQHVETMIDKRMVRKAVFKKINGMRIEDSI